MAKTGFVGFGNMGRVLIRSLLASKGLAPKDCWVHTRSMDKLKPLLNQYPQVKMAASVKDAARDSRYLFICTGTYDVKAVLEKAIPFASNGLHVVTISAGLELATLEMVFPGKISRIMPTMLAEVNAGVTLIAHNAKVGAGDKAALAAMLEHVNEVVQVEESQFETGADLTSCAPAFIAEMITLYARAVEKHSRYAFEDADRMFKKTIAGTLRLLEQRKETSSELVRRVATKGGSTEAGILVLRSALPEVFDVLLEKTLEPQVARKSHTRSQFGLEAATETK
jgi:pyrroline-5-carboxylate reductase